MAVLELEYLGCQADSFPFLLHDLPICCIHILCAWVLGKPSNGLGLRWVNPGLSLGWAGFIGLGSLNGFPGPGRA